MPSIPFYVVLGPGRAQFGILVGFSIAYITLVLGAGACYRMDSANISYCEKSLACFAWVGYQTRLKER